MLINVIIEYREPDHIEYQVLVEANNAHEAAEKIIEIAKSMHPDYEYSFRDEATLRGWRYTWIYAQKPNDEFDLPFIIARIPEQKATSIEDIKGVFYESQIL